MTKKTAIALVIDKSGSMSPFREDVIGAVNTFLEQQKAIGEDCRVSMTLFDTSFEKRFEATPINSVPPLSKASYQPSGMTALWDAVGTTIDGLGANLAALPEAERPEVVIVVVQTDGQENSSREYTAERVKSMIEHQRNAYSWHFVFLGADQDAWIGAGAIGIDRAQTLSYRPQDSRRAYGMVGQSVGALRRGEDGALESNDLRDE